MPIEFRCSGCNQLLRVPETAAGQQAKCPNCSAVQTIPAASAPAAVPPPPPMPAADSANPIAAPSSVRSYDYASGALDDLERNGPPWECDGKSLESFWATFKLVLTDPAKMFSTMNRNGGLGSPIVYNLLGSTIGMGIAVIFSSLVQMGIRPAGPGGFFNDGFFLFFCCSPLVLVPLMSMVRLFVWGAIVHLMLMIVGGARQPIETTLRVVAYSGGTCDLVAIVPLVGAWVAVVMHIVYAIFGVMHAHEISGGKATLAVLLPAICCCGLGLLGIVSIVAMFAANIH